jgi:hypothetical protein
MRFRSLLTDLDTWTSSPYAFAIDRPLRHFLAYLQPWGFLRAFPLLPLGGLLDLISTLSLISVTVPRGVSMMVIISSTDTEVGT